MSEFTKTEPRRESPVPASIWYAFGVLIVFFYFFGLTIPLLGPDEPRYAQVAREMFERGDWITPTLGGFNWFEKPALLYWLQIASYNLFGVNEFAARFGSALCGLGVIVCMWLLGRFAVRFEGPTQQPHVLPSDFGHWLALIAASTLGIMVFARGASFDIAITFPITASIVSFFIFEQSRKRARGGYIALAVFYVFIGLGLLAKGLIGAVFPIAIVSLFYLLSWRRPPAAFLFSLVWGGLLALAIAAVWYWPMYMRHGYEFIDEFFIQHHFRRFTSNKYRHPQPFYFFFWVLPLMTLPWLPFSIAAIIRVFRAIFPRQETTADAETRAHKSALVERIALAFKLAPGKTIRVIASTDLVALGLAWLIVPLAFFSFSGSKLPGYILPAVPPTVILTAAYVSRLALRGNGWRNAALATAFLTLSGAILLIIFIVPGFAEADSVKSLITAANERGYSTAPVASVHTVSHNAEYYAAGRVMRDPSGRQRRFSGNDELIAAIRSENLPAVVALIPLEYLPTLAQDDRIKSEVLRDNGELAVAIVSPR